MGNKKEFLPNQTLETRITKSILKKSPSSSGVICLTLFEMGNAVLDSFFPENYSFARPSRRIFGLASKNKWPSRKTIQAGLYRLIEFGIVEKKQDGFSLTKTGKALSVRILGKKKSLEKKWDGKYRLVIFDIPEQKKKVRNWLREELYLLEYDQLQKSVFVGKHPLTSEIIGDIGRLGIREYVNYLLVDKIYDTRKVKRQQFIQSAD